MAAYAPAAGMAVSGVVGIATPALAAPTCYELSCNNLELTSTNCKSDAFAIDGTALKDSSGNLRHEANLWFSPSCHAFWGDWNQKDQGGVDIALWSIAEYAEGSGYKRLLDSFPQFSGPGVWTTKLYSSRASVKFCWTQAGQGGDMGDVVTDLGACTKWR
jgi:hypothetical protein